VTASLQIIRQRVTKRFFFRDIPHERGLSAGQVIGQLCLEIFDFLDRNVVHQAVLNGPENCRLHLDQNRAVLGLFEYFNDAFSAFKLRLRFGIKIRAKLRETPRVRGIAPSPV